MSLVNEHWLSLCLWLCGMWLVLCLLTLAFINNKLSILKNTNTKLAGPLAISPGYSGSNGYANGVLFPLPLDRWTLTSCYHPRLTSLLRHFHVASSLPHGTTRTNQASTYTSLVPRLWMTV